MSDPYARMSDSAPAKPERTVYVHRRPHRIVPGAFHFSLSDNANLDMAENRNFY